MNNPLDGWVSYLERCQPLIDLLKSQGVTTGEALQIIELNLVQQKLDVLIRTTDQLNLTVNNLIIAIKKATSDGDEKWRGE